MSCHGNKPWISTNRPSNNSAMNNNYSGFLTQQMVTLMLFYSMFYDIYSFAILIGNFSNKVSN